MPFEGFPFNIGWELTLACNLRCSHCGSSAGQPKPNELTTKEALKICDQFPALVVQEVDFTGGEPLIRADWPEIALHLKDLDISTNMVTNGMAMDRNTIDIMKEVGISNVGISLDGLELTHDRIRGVKGAFHKIINCMNIMKEAGQPFVVLTTVNSLNIRELPAIMNLLLSLGVTRWRAQPLIPMGRAKGSIELEMKDEDMLELGRFIRNYRVNAEKNGLEITPADGLQYIDESWMPELPWTGCSAGWITCGITSDGKIKGCLSLSDEWIEGDLRKEDLWDIWFRPGSFACTRNFTKNQLGDNCRFCDKALDCLGGCSSSSYASTGAFHNDPCCFRRVSREGCTAPDMIAH